MDNFDVELKMEICDFSSLFVGAVPLSSLLRYGLAEISDYKYSKPFPIGNGFFCDQIRNA